MLQDRSRIGTSMHNPFAEPWDELAPSAPRLAEEAQVLRAALRDVKSRRQWARLRAQEAQSQFQALAAQVAVLASETQQEERACASLEREVARARFIDRGGYRLLASANFGELVLGCIEAKFCK